jgi:hypothetical protein
MKQSKAGAVLPETYKAMCRQCGDIVQHRLHRVAAVPCSNGHLVAPTIARAALVREQRDKPAGDAGGAPLKVDIRR